MLRQQYTYITTYGWKSRQFIVHLSLLMGKTGMVITLMEGGGQTVILVVVKNLCHVLELIG